MPIERIKYTIDNIRQGKKENIKAVAGVTMKPVAGLFRVFAGDIGEACYSSKHRVLADNTHPNIGTWIFTTKAGNKVVIRGSMLGIEAVEDDDKDPEAKSQVLVARANNPRENFIQGIDADQFVRASLKEVINTAKRRRKEGTKFKVAIPLDNVGQSSSNRSAVSRVYRQRFEKCEKIGLVDNLDTKFNNYAIWNKNGIHACVVIWEVDEAGNETWHGDWND